MKKTLYICGLLIMVLWVGCSKPPVSTVLNDESQIFIESPNQCPEITEVSLSDSSVEGGKLVKITITAVDPDNDEMHYLWTASRGEILGDKEQVVWTAPECSETDMMSMTYDVSVNVSDGICTADRTVAIAVRCGAQMKGASDAVILFPLGGTGLSNIAKAKLDNLAALLKQYPDRTINIVGHTDSTGSNAANEKIGMRRAESVTTYLQKRHGLDAERMIASSAGSTQPAASNDTKAGHAENRRVEIHHAN